MSLKHNGSFVANMENVLDVYKRPNNPLNPVPCINGLPKQLIEEIKVSIPASKGQPENQDY